MHLQNIREWYGPAAEEVRAGADVQRAAGDVTAQEARLQALQTQLAAAIAAPPPIRWTADATYCEFRERVWQVRHAGEGEAEAPASASASDGEDDGDVVVAAVRQTLVCPLTQTTFEQPVTNPTCGHTYSRDAVRALARSAATIPCPLHGCSSSVTLALLRPNEALARRIARRARWQSGARIFD